MNPAQRSTLPTRTVTEEPQVIRLQGRPAAEPLPVVPQAPTPLEPRMEARRQALLQRLQRPAVPAARIERTQNVAATVIAVVQPVRAPTPPPPVVEVEEIPEQAEEEENLQTIDAVVARMMRSPVINDQAREGIADMQRRIADADNTDLPRMIAFLRLRYVTPLRLVDTDQAEVTTLEGNLRAILAAAVPVGADAEAYFESFRRLVERRNFFEREFDALQQLFNEIEQYIDAAEEGALTRIDEMFVPLRTRLQELNQAREEAGLAADARVEQLRQQMNARSAAIRTQNDEVTAQGRRMIEQNENREQMIREYYESQ